MKYFALLAAALAAFPGMPVAAASVVPEFAIKTHDDPRITVSIHSPAQFVAYVNRLTADQMEPFPADSVCSLRAFAAAGDRPAITIATVRTSRDLCNVLIITEAPGGLFAYDVWQEDDVNRMIDLGSHGKIGIFLDQLWYPMGGLSFCSATWRSHLSLDRDPPVDDSSQRSDIYRARYNETMQALRNLQAEKKTRDPVDFAMRDAGCLIMERDRLGRLLNNDPSIGVKGAEDWMHDADPALRGAAVAIFSTIQSDVARHSLDILKHDPDASVRARAINSVPPTAHQARNNAPLQP